MTNKQCFAIFKTMNSEHSSLFPDVKYFSLQVNSIIDQGGFTNLKKKVFKNPIYNVEYTLKDLDYINDALHDIEHEEAYGFDKLYLICYLSIKFEIQHTHPSKIYGF